MNYIIIFSICGIIMELYHITFHAQTHWLLYWARKIRKFESLGVSMELQVRYMEEAIRNGRKGSNPYIYDLSVALSDKVFQIRQANNALKQEIENYVILNGGYSKTVKAYLWDKTFTKQQSRLVVINSIIELCYLAAIVGLVYQLATEGFSSLAWASGIILFILSTISAINDYGEKPISTRYWYIDAFTSIAVYAYMLGTFCFFSS